jgi:hypothetical protein
LLPSLPSQIHQIHCDLLPSTLDWIIFFLNQKILIR